MNDIISRQAVNDALDKTCDIVCQYSKKQRYAMCGACPLGSAYDVIENAPSVDEWTIVTEYCRKRNLVIITMESFRVLQAYYNRQNGMGGD